MQQSRAFSTGLQLCNIAVPLAPPFHCCSDRHTRSQYESKHCSDELCMVRRFCPPKFSTGFAMPLAGLGRSLLLSEKRQIFSQSCCHLPAGDDFCMPSLGSAGRLHQDGICCSSLRCFSTVTNLVLESAGPWSCDWPCMQGQHSLQKVLSYTEVQMAFSCQENSLTSVFLGMLVGITQAFVQRMAAFKCDW